VFSLPVHSGENSTFHLRYRGPQLRCTVSRYNGSIPLQYTLNDVAMTGLVFVSEWDPESLLYSVTQHQIGNLTMRGPQNVTSYEAIVETTSYEAIVETTKQSCESVSVLYAVDVTFPRGVQTIQHSLSDVRALPKKEDIFDKVDNIMPTMALDLPPEPLALQDWHQRVLAALPISNEWAVLDALGSVLTGKFYERSPTPHLDKCRKRNNPNNDTEIHDCWGWGDAFYYPRDYSSEVYILT
jgi:hypothetical protein